MTKEYIFYLTSSKLIKTMLSILDRLKIFMNKMAKRNQKLVQRLHLINLIRINLKEGKITKSPKNNWRVSNRSQVIYWRIIEGQV